MNNHSSDKMKDDGCCRFDDAHNMRELVKMMPSESELFDLSDLFKLFGDSSRLKILFVLKEDKELCVRHISECLGMSMSAVSHQLKPLRDAKLIKSRREGKEIYYSLDDEHVDELITIASIHISELEG